MGANQLFEPYYRYKSLNIIRPNWGVWKKIINVCQAYTSFFQQRLNTCVFLLFGYFPFQTKIVGAKSLDTHIANGAIFVSIHSGPYPLAIKIIKDTYPKLSVVVPFYVHRAFSSFTLFKKLCAPLGIDIVPLGGAMNYIRPALKDNHSVCLFLDAEYPIKHTVNVTLFNKTIPISSGPVWLAKTFHKPIIPFYTARENNRIILRVLDPITNIGQSEQTIAQELADDVEEMITNSLTQWQVTDRFLLPHLL